MTPAVTNQAGDTAIITVIPKSGPSAVETKDLVAGIRDLRGSVETQTGTDILVTGNTAVGIDISQKLASALPIFLLLVVGLSFILLMIVFRSLLVPLKATLGFLLSVGATFGARGRGLPVGLALGAARRRRHRPDHQLPAGPPDRPALRARHGLRGVPGQPDARGPHARRQPDGVGDRRLPARCPGGHGGGSDHGLGLRRLHARRRPDHQERSASPSPSASSSTPSSYG